MVFERKTRKQKGSWRHRAVIYSFVAVSELDHQQLVFLFHVYILNRQSRNNRLKWSRPVASYLASCHSHLPHKCSELVHASLVGLHNVLVESPEIVAAQVHIDELWNWPKALARVTISTNSSFGLRGISLILESSAQVQCDSCFWAIVETSHAFWIGDEQNRVVAHA